MATNKEMTYKEFLELLEELQLDLDSASEALDLEISDIELRLYLEKIDQNLGAYSLITSFVRTNKGTIEMIYDEGFLGEDALSRAFTFLTTNLGLSGLVLRSIISIRQKISD